MDVRVGIVSWQTAELLDRCLAALPAALGDLRSEVVVVDNASSDRSVEIARGRGARVVVNTRNEGYARAMNAALAGTSAAYLVALNPDTEARPHSIERLVERLVAEPRLGLIAPRLLNPDGSVQHSVHRFPSVSQALVMGLVPLPLRRGFIGRHFWLAGYADHERRATVDWIVGAVHVIRRAALADPAHAYPERTFMYAEDMALCWTLRVDGWEVGFEPSAEVVHVGGAAAQQAFGSGIDVRRLEADYDWYQATRGMFNARLWAAANVLGFGAKLAMGRISRPPDDPRTQRTRKFLRLHASHLRSSGEPQLHH
jgi:N-acetylglucosaminyl-diphospho-decaprenol L-rhamnosyltransferase